MRVSGATVIANTLLNQVLVSAKTNGVGSPYSITTTDSNTRFTNEGATAEVYLVLPTAVAGLTFVVMCQDSDGIRVVANTGDTIRMGASVSASAGYIRSTSIGSVTRLTCINATEWFSEYVTGTFTIDS
jgi:hypothetical protein